MKSKQAIVILLAAALPVTAFAQEPVQNVRASRHGNLAAAQSLSRQAYDRLTAAQKVNEFDMGGHAQRAKELLRQVNQEIAAAAHAANTH